MLSASSSVVLSSIRHFNGSSKYSRPFTVAANLVPSATSLSSMLLALAIEDSIVLSLLRRVMGTFFGFLRTNFVFVRGADAEIFGEFNRKFTLLDRYVLDLSTDSARTFDRRVPVAPGGVVGTGGAR